MEEPFFFETEGSRLFAMAHRPTNAVAGAPGVVICHPYGEEKQLSEPVLVRCARSLARDGFPVMRFDCRGYGDSQGELEDATIGTQIADTLAAARMAREVLQVEHVVFLGLRFGASVAVRAAERDPIGAGLVLWSPIVKGSDYVNEMIRKRLFADVFEKRTPSRERVLEELAVEGRIEIEGQFLTRRMADEMSDMDLPAEVANFRDPVFVSAVRTRAAKYPQFESLARAYEAVGAPCTFEIGGEKPFWERSAMYHMYVPEDLFGLTRRWMRTHWQEM
jgi:pimeloyl-ACP methyl ester carboxylesterase